MRDPQVRRALELIPEIRELPEWAQQRTWYEREGFDFEAMPASTLWHWILGPYLTHALETGGEPVGRILAILEEMLATDDSSITSTARHTLEWCVFRQKLSDASWPLLGPRSKNLLGTLRAKWEPWERVLAILDDLYEKVQAAVQEKYSSLRAGSTVYPRSGRFYYYLEFMYDPAGQRFHDLLLEFFVDSNIQAGRIRYPEGGDRDYVLYEMWHGSGDPSVELGPVFLRGARLGDEYMSTVIDFAKQAVEFTWAHLSLFLPVLAVPYDVEGEYFKLRRPAPSRWLTMKLHHSDEPEWQELRAFLFAKGAEPRSTVLAALGTPRPMELMITRDRRLFVITSEGGGRSLLGEWGEVFGADESLPSDEGLDACLQLLN
jgi:hypothetical protein